MFHYKCSLSEVLKHPEFFPLLVNSLASYQGTARISKCADIMIKIKVCLLISLKGRVDKMTWSVNSMSFPYIKGAPKQQIAMREFKKMKINVGFIKNLSFPPKYPSEDKEYSAVQAHHKHSKLDMKDVLYQYPINRSIRHTSVYIILSLFH